MTSRPYLQEIAERIMVIAHEHNIKLEVKWISRESGKIRMADTISKEPDFGDYRLSDGSFAFITSRLGVFDTDYFASEWSHRLRPF